MRIGQEADIMFFNLILFKQREILDVICPFPVHVTTEGSGGTNSCNIPLFVTVFPFKYMQYQFCELVRHPRIWDAVACYLICLPVHLRSQVAPTSALNNAVSVEQNSHRWHR